MAFSKSEKTAGLVMGIVVVLVVGAIAASWLAGSPAPAPSVQQAQPADSATTKSQ